MSVWHDAGPALHFDLDAGNLRPARTKNFPQRGQQLPELCGNRAVCGVDNDTPHFVVRHLAGFGQVMGGGSRVDLLQCHKALGVRCEPF